MIKSITQNLSVVLDRSRLDILPLLQVFQYLGFYLAGGTALALMFGHRKSEDFDFFIDADFDTEELFIFCKNHFPGRHMENILETKNTLWIMVDTVKISFFTLKAPLLYPMIETPYFRVASVHDIGAMKLGAIQHRATTKDYIDLAYILRIIPLLTLLEDFTKKYGNIMPEIRLLKSLIYFADVDGVGVQMLDENYSWIQIQAELKKGVREYMERK